MANARKISLLVAISFFAVVGVTLTIVACVKNHNALPLVLVAVYVAACLPELMCRKCHFEERERCQTCCTDRYETYVSTGHFFTSVLAVTGIALPIVLFRASAITFVPFILSLIGIVLFVVCCVIFVQCFYIKDDDF